MKRKILFVGFQGSIHVARWINILNDTEWRRFLCGVYDAHVHPELSTKPLFPFFPITAASRKVNWAGLPLLLERLLTKLMPNRDWRIDWLEFVIRRVKPDLIHSMEFQVAGYRCLKVKERMGDDFPPWLATNYGSDIFLFGRIAAHRERIKAILKAANFYSAECRRDILLAQKIGLRAKPMPVLPNAGGIDLVRAKVLRTPGPTSKRNVIVVKGYQHFAGRALVALKALELAADYVRPYEIKVFSACPDVEIACELLSQDAGLNIVCIPSKTSHQEMLRLHGSARVSLAVSISDGVSTSFLEALAMGSFPIQTYTACADEWIEDGVSGFLVPPDAPDVIADRLIQALTDDALVDRAAEINQRTAADRLDGDVVKFKAIQMYEDIFRHIDDAGGRHLSGSEP